MKCLLCHDTAKELVEHKCSSVMLYQCGTCSLIFKDPKVHLDLTAAKLRYENHENDPTEKSYQDFLSKVVGPVLTFVKSPATGLDFGCGPTKPIAHMLTPLGFSIESYDLVFLNNSKALEDKYDFIICSETAEHFTAPRKDFEQLQHCLNDLGYLGLMTAMPPVNLDELRLWFYPSDKTHVCFYPFEARQWIAELFGWEIAYHQGEVTVFRKGE